MNEAIDVIDSFNSINWFAFGENIRVCRVRFDDELIERDAKVTGQK